MTGTKHQGGYLTLYSPDRAEIYGELAGAVWEEEFMADGQPNTIFGGPAGDGTAETLVRLNQAGVEHVSYDFQAEGKTFSGMARLLALEHADAPARLWVRAEALGAPVASE